MSTEDQVRAVPLVARTTRRALLGVGLGFAGALMAACAGAPTPTPAPDKPAAAPTAAPPAPTAQAAQPAPVTQPTQAPAKPTAVTQPTAAAKPAPSGAGVTLNLLGHSSPQTDKSFARLKEFEQQTGAKVPFQTIPAGDYEKKATAEFVAKSGSIDVLQVPGAILLTGAKNKWIEPLEKYLKDPAVSDPNYNFDDFSSGIVDNIAYYEKTLWALPWRSDVRTIYYRTDVFKAKNVTPPKTWDEYFAVLDKVHAPPEIYGVAIHGRQYAATLSAFNDLLWTHGGDYLTDQMKPRFNDETGVKALTAYVKILEKAPPDKFNMGAFEAATAFAQGKTAMLHMWPLGAASAEDEKQSKVIGKWSLFLMPSAQGVKTTSTIGGWGISIAADSKHKELAFKLAQFMTTAKAEKEVILAGGDANPCRKSTLNDPDVTKKYFHFPLLVQAFDNGRVPPRIPEWGQATDEIVKAMSEAATGKKTVKAALDDAAKQVESILQKAGYYK